MIVYVCMCAIIAYTTYYVVHRIHQKEQVATVLSIPSQQGSMGDQGQGSVAWRHRQHQKARCEELFVITLGIFLIFFWGGFIHLVSTRHDELVADLAAVRSMPCPFHCDCGEGIPRHAPELTASESLYYATIGPTHVEECKKHLAALDAWPWPNPFRLMREYILENLTALASTLGACIAGFLMQFPVIIQMWLTTLFALGAMLVLMGATPAVMTMLPRGWKPRRITQAPKSMVTVEDITYEEEGRMLAIEELERP